MTSLHLPGLERKKRPQTWFVLLNQETQKGLKFNSWLSKLLCSCRLVVAVFCGGGLVVAVVAGSCGGGCGLVVRPDAVLQALG